MGMDLIARKPTSEKYGSQHLNWSGWSSFGDILQELGCDLSEMSGSNDGHYIKKATALSWGNAIMEALDRMYVVEYPDKHFYGGIRTEVKVEGSATPMIMSTHELISAIFAESELNKVIGTASNTTCSEPSGDGVEVKVVNELDVVPKSYPLKSSKEDLEWLTEVAEFLINCGGCYQW